MASLSGSMSKLHRKVALVIGNQNYSKKPLANSVNDANDLADALRTIGFEVTLGTDCTHQKMANLIDNFADEIQDQDLVMFYFAGHGFQYKEQNYLLPVDADEKIKRETNIKFNSVNAQETLESLSSQTSYATIFILDCCREYLFDDTSKFRGAKSSGSGLHAMIAPGGTLLQFACAPGSLAADGGGQDRNGLYTKHLLKQIVVPNKHIDLIFSSVGAEVYEEINIPANAKWAHNGVTIAGGHGKGDATNQLNRPHGLFVDDDQTVLIADHSNHRIMQWKNGGTTNGQVVAGGKGKGKGLHQLNSPTDVLIDKETDSLIICDCGNRRVVRWSRRSGTTQGEVLIDNIQCYGVAMDEQRYLYVADYGKDEVRRYQLGEKNGTLVAGGNGATEGIVVAGGEGGGNALTQLYHPHGLFVDTLDTFYVADCYNYRVMRWTQGDKKQGTLVVGGDRRGEGANQFNFPIGLSFDRHGNLYVADRDNNRVQRFSIE
ncbi:unnamed protein product [Rotaria socialis]|uniref:Caspase family p20 domain-containing protein n=1 Tax=Rotaria socialis TaxID=392032 RepID=A0A817YMA6_9BILA|nr:unnamed protein product [Rotaria socialis]